LSNGENLGSIKTSLHNLPKSGTEDGIHKSRGVAAFVALAGGKDMPIALPFEEGHGVDYVQRAND